MKKSLISVALMALVGLMTAGLAHADNRNAWQMTCDFGSIGCDASARIVFSNTKNESPQSFGTLMAVECKGELISASDATLYRLTGDSNDFRYQLDNSDATVHVLMKDHPFHDNGPNTVDSAIKIGDGFAPGTCSLTRLH